VIPRAGTDRWKLYGSSLVPGRTVGSCMGVQQAVADITRACWTFNKLWRTSRERVRRLTSCGGRGFSKIKTRTPTSKSDIAQKVQRTGYILYLIFRVTST